MFFYSIVQCVYCAMFLGVGLSISFVIILLQLPGEYALNETNIENIWFSCKIAGVFHKNGKITRVGMYVHRVIFTLL